MSGTVLFDRGILSKMEQEIAGVYIPVQLAEGDDGGDVPKLTPDSQVFTAEQLSRLRSYVEGIVRDTAALIAAGETEPRPMKKKQQSSHFYADACAYCDYRTLCGITDSDIIGVLTNFRRKGKDYSVQSAGFRLYSRVWNLIYPLRWTLHKARRLAGKIKRAIKGGA